MSIAAARCRRQHAPEHAVIAGAKSLKVAPTFAQRHMVGAGVFIRAVHIPAAVFPEADAADAVLATIIELEVVAARALVQQHGSPFKNSVQIKM